MQFVVFCYAASSGYGNRGELGPMLGTLLQLHCEAQVAVLEVTKENLKAELAML
jgi:hypothetical protein